MIELVIILAFISCNTTKDNKNIEQLEGEKIFWDFNNLDGWSDGSQNMDGIINYLLKGDTLEIFTRPNTYDRPKVRSQFRKYKQGKYTWRAYIPEMGVGDMASVGCFLYYDDKHELDFEIGYGNSDLRKSLLAKDDELVVYMTSQGNPCHQKLKTIKCNKWYNFSIELKLENNKYKVIWSIDDDIITSKQMLFGPEIPFYVFASMENLTFIGDHIPTQRNYALFDYIKFSPYH
uniref:hypothetical protein n=1 Tax=uncultured Draconibacterium sp. TaxID=1573823 RepID=UPI003216D269